MVHVVIVIGCCDVILRKQEVFKEPLLNLLKATQQVTASQQETKDRKNKEKVQDTKKETKKISSLWSS